MWLEIILRNAKCVKMTESPIGLDCILSLNFMTNGKYVSQGNQA